MCRLQITVGGACTHFLSEMETNTQCWERLAGVNQRKGRRWNALRTPLQFFCRLVCFCFCFFCPFCSLKQSMIFMWQFDMHVWKNISSAEQMRGSLLLYHTRFRKWSTCVWFGALWIRWCRTRQRTHVNWIDSVWEILQNTKTTLSWKLVKTKSCVRSLRCVKGGTSRTWVVTHWCCWTVSAAELHQLLLSSDTESCSVAQPAICEVSGVTRPPACRMFIEWGIEDRLPILTWSLDASGSPDQILCCCRI